MRYATTRTPVTLGLVALCLWLSAPALAQVTDVSLPDDITGMVGDRVSTDMRFDNAPGITGITIDIGFNPQIATPDTDITMGPFGSSILNVHGANIIEPDTLRVVVAAGDAVGYVGSGVMLTIDWDLVGAGTANLDFIRVLLEDNQSPPALPANPINGRIVVEGGGGGGGDCPCSDTETRVRVTDAQGRDGDRVFVDVLLQNSATPIDAFGLTLGYDNSKLRFVPGSGTCVDLTEDWIFCDASENTPGQVTVGGFHTSQIPVGSSGTLARLSFDVVCDTCPDGDSTLLELSNLLDDLEGIETCCGVFGFGDQCLSDGDVDLNGLLSPGDAQCAFKVFLNGQVVPAECDVAESTCEVSAADVNCDRVVSPGDAQSIFARWLDNGVPSPCFGSVPRGTGVLAGRLEAVDSFAIEVGGAGGDVVQLPVVARATGSMLAFGADVRFDPSVVSFVGFERTPSGESWQALDALERDGVVRVGGFHKLDADGGETVIGHVTFSRKADGPAGIEVEWIERLSRDAASSGPRGSLAVPAFRVGRAYPNPLRSSTLASLVVPAGYSDRVQASVYDVFGRAVRTLVDGPIGDGFHQIEWDRTDRNGLQVGSGIYFLRVEAGTFASTQKITVVE